MTLSPYEAADAINHVAALLETVDAAIDRLCEKVPTSTAHRLLAIVDLSAINPSLAHRLRCIAEACEDEGTAADEALMIEAAEAEYEQDMAP